MPIQSTDPIAVLASIARVHRPEPYELCVVRVRSIPIFLQEVDYDELEARSGLVGEGA